MGSDAVGVGVIGYGWISRAHAHALHTLNHIDPLPKRVRLVAMAGPRAEPLERAARELGFERWTTSWEELLDDPEVDVVANLLALEGHAEPSIAALERGKPVLCEKPLGVDSAQARTMRDAAAAAGVANAVGFNYRYVPAVALAKQVLDEERLGELRHYRALYLQDYQNTGDQKRSSGGAGAVLDYSHLVDMLRFLVGEPSTVAASTSSFLTDVDDAYVALFEFAHGLVAALEASRVATGWKGRHRIEVNGSRGSLWWDMEDTNRLHVFLAADEERGWAGSATSSSRSPTIRISASGGHRGTSSAGSTASCTSGATFSRRCSRSEQSRPGRRLSRTGIARPSCARRSTHPRGKGGASTSQRPQRRSDNQGQLLRREANEREQHAA